MLYWPAEVCMVIIDALLCMVAVIEPLTHSSRLQCTSIEASTLGLGYIVIPRLHQALLGPAAECCCNASCEYYLGRCFCAYANRLAATRAPQFNFVLVTACFKWSVAVTFTFSDLLVVRQRSSQKSNDRQRQL